MQHIVLMLGVLVRFRRSSPESLAFVSFVSVKTWLQTQIQVQVQITLLNILLNDFLSAKDSELFCRRYYTYPATFNPTDLYKQSHLHVVYKKAAKRPRKMLQYPYRSDNVKLRISLTIMAGF